MRRQADAFTLVELIVVITVIVLILAIAIPGLSAMNQQSRLSAATQTINGAMTRAYYGALADVNMTAVRFLPGEWDYNEAKEAQRPTGRTHLLTYSYVSTTSADPNDVTDIALGEYFQRREGTDSVQLPDDIGIAPIEALSSDSGYVRVGPDSSGAFSMWSLGNVGKDFVLTGTPGEFKLDAGDTGTNFLQADDFLVVFDSQTGLRGGVPTPTRIKAYDPDQNLDTDRNGNVYYQRYNFSGIVIYPRRAFLALGNDPQTRQDWLRANGRPYLVHRLGGGLVMGTQGVE
ncbi:MAG: prepilin-type N-terminal cleavage/methylation domain-containing protein [Phycisphaerae bacterium]